ncbi:MAG: transcriptional regulator [Gammaproteobacteria bacterium]|nr:MAG: transcriptional regulator [Gammaproteobacteria bacterium]
MFTFIESSTFERILPVYLDDDEYSELQQFLLQNPEAGDVVAGSGGVRKMRWARPGMGKRGGLRIIYFVRYEPNEFWMLTLYAKAKRDNVPAYILKQLLEAFRNE